MKIPSSLSQLLPPTLGLLGAALLLAPAQTRVFEVYGDHLDLTQRDFRILNSFTDFRANANQVPDPDFPGSLGAELAIRKGVAEWGSRPHGSGITDPLQDQLGSGNSNFDAFYAGRALQFGGQNRNIISAIPGGAGAFAFTDLPIGDGWRIRFVNGTKDWNGLTGRPQGGLDRWDIQGTATHEYGHALGLNHSLLQGVTMSLMSQDLAVDFRTLEQDDIDGVQFIYGVRDPLKPVVDTYELLGGGMLRILGSGFDPARNEIWFTTKDPTDASNDAPTITVGDVASTQGGTVIDVMIPAEAGAGSVAVKIPGNRFFTLSNVYPLDPLLEPWTPPITYGAPTISSSGTPLELSWSGLPSFSVANLRITVAGGPPGQSLGFLIEGTSRATTTTPYGTLLVGGSLRRVNLLFPVLNGDGQTLTPFRPGGGVGEKRFYQVWIRDTASPGGGILSDALEVEITL